MTIRMIQQILDKAETTGALRDDFASVSFGTNAIYYLNMRLKGMKLVGQRLDKKHKEYKEGKKVIKGIIKRQQFRGNVIPWCQFASFELETSSLPEVISEIYLQALQLAWSLKQKSNLQKALLSSFYVLSHLSESILNRADSIKHIATVRNSFISILGSIFLDEDTPTLDKKFENVQILRIR